MKHVLIVDDHAANLYLLRPTASRRWRRRGNASPT